MRVSFTRDSRVVVVVVVAGDVDNGKVERAVSEKNAWWTPPCCSRSSQVEKNEASQPA